MPKKHQRRPAPPAKPSGPATPEAGLREVARLVERRKLLEARALLGSLDHQHPDNRAVLRRLADVNALLKDAMPYQNACERLLALEPGDPDLQFELASAYLRNNRPALALRQFQALLELHPTHAYAAEAREHAGAIEATLEALLHEVGLSSAAGLDFATRHEELQIAISHGEYGRVPELAEEILAIKPDFAPALNNLSQAYLLSDLPDQAIDAAQRVLAFAPENVHALANLVFFNCRLGRLEQARAFAERLKASQAPASERWLKVAEALSFLGDDLGVLEAFATGSAQMLSPNEAGQLYHFAAVAKLRQGDERAARGFWQAAIAATPGLEIARANLSDLRNPIAERHTPWPFEFNHWISQATIELLLQGVRRHAGHEVPTRAIREFLAERPEVGTLVPVLLDRGDPGARQFVLMLAESAELPELNLALRDFALSQRGPDAQRQQALRIAQAAGLFPDRKARVWFDGEWRDIELMGFELTGEPFEGYAPEVQELMHASAEALHGRQWQKSERLLRQALEIEPNSPSILNNLAMAIGNQGDTATAEQMTLELHERFPDYSFARISVARMRLRDGNLEAAEKLTKPLIARARLHYSEAAALFGLKIDLEIARGRPEGARTWLDIWEQADPDSRQLEHYRHKLGVTAPPAARRSSARSRSR